jgi:D-glycero-D-manno-heptose 1,7-bisphosphate phosphatase
MKKCIFFDRDGIVNKSPGPGYVEKGEDFKLLPEFVEVLRIAQRLGYEAVVVTNQQGVAKGVVSLEEVEKIHANLKKVLKDKYNLALLDIMCCPHREGTCECRKPKPGMILEAAKRHGIDLKSSWMVGDDVKDVETGKRAGCRTIFVGPQGKGSGADYVVENMAELQKQIGGKIKDFDDVCGA